MSDNPLQQIHPRNLLDALLSESSDVILAQKRIKKARGKFKYFREHTSEIHGFCKKEA